MNEEIANETFHRLITSLEHNGFNWIVNQIQETIDAGKPIERQVQLLALPSDDHVQLRAPIESIDTYRPSGGRPTNFPAREEYSSQEKLSLTIDAVQRSLVDTVKMEQFIYDRLIRDTEGIAEMVFAEDNAEIRDRMDAPGMAEATSHSQQLYGLLSELRSIMEQTS